MKAKCFQKFVSHSVFTGGGGGSVSREGFCQYSGSLISRDFLSGGGVVCSGGSLSGQWSADGTHPTGMHCCCSYCLCRNYRIQGSGAWPCAGLSLLKV